MSIRSALALAMLAGAFACSKTGEQDTNVPLAQPSGESGAAAGGNEPALPPASKAAIDSGNVLFRTKDYTGALAEYRMAAKLSPEPAAPLFGIYMVAMKLNNRALADSAMAGLRARNVSPSAEHAETHEQSPPPVRRNQER